MHTPERPRDAERPRVLYLLRTYPVILQTYIKTEIEALQDDVDIRVVTARSPRSRYRHHLPHEVTKDPGEVREIIEDFQPDILHAHYLTQLEFVAALARATGVPFTIRSHSFDVLWGGVRGAMQDALPWRVRPLLPAHLRNARQRTQDDLCLGVICFPFVRERLAKIGVPEEKLHDCWPVVDIARFLDRSPNGHDLMHVGAVIAKKRMQDYIDLASALPDRSFDLYPLGRRRNQVEALNDEAAVRVNISPEIQPEDMPREFKRHEWLVYTGSRRHRSVGWPMSVAEAQASGTGVLMPDLGRDVHEYIGPAGFVYRSLDEARRILEQPYPDEMREAGFEHAGRSDIRNHVHVLTDLWDRVLPSPLRRTTAS